MINKNISAHVILGLINYYKESFMLINSNGEYSTMFKTTVGVKQGGTASPKLFSVYIEELN